jgi:hypothetical protein
MMILKGIFWPRPLLLGIFCFASWSWSVFKLWIFGKGRMSLVCNLTCQICLYKSLLFYNLISTNFEYRSINLFIDRKIFIYVSFFSWKYHLWKNFFCFVLFKKLRARSSHRDVDFFSRLNFFLQKVTNK